MRLPRAPEFEQPATGQPQGLPLRGTLPATASPCKGRPCVCPPCVRAERLGSERLGTSLVGGSARVGPQAWLSPLLVWIDESSRLPIGLLQAGAHGRVDRSWVVGEGIIADCRAGCNRGRAARMDLPVAKHRRRLDGIVSTCSEDDRSRRSRARSRCRTSLAALVPALRRWGPGCRLRSPSTDTPA